MSCDGISIDQFFAFFLYSACDYSYLIIRVQKFQWPEINMCNLIN